MTRPACDTCRNAFEPPLARPSWHRCERCTLASPAAVANAARQAHVKRRAASLATLRDPEGQEAIQDALTAALASGCTCTPRVTVAQGHEGKITTTTAHDAGCRAQTGGAT